MTATAWAQGRGGASRLPAIQPLARPPRAFVVALRTFTPTLAARPCPRLPLLHITAAPRCDSARSMHPRAPPPRPCQIPIHSQLPAHHWQPHAAPVQSPRKGAELREGFCLLVRVEPVAQCLPHTQMRTYTPIETASFLSAAVCSAPNTFFFGTFSAKTPVDPTTTVMRCHAPIVGQTCLPKPPGPWCLIAFAALCVAASQSSQLASLRSSRLCKGAGSCRCGDQGTAAAVARNCISLPKQQRHPIARKHPSCSQSPSSRPRAQRDARFCVDAAPWPACPAAPAAASSCSAAASPAMVP